ncbi:prolyl oligopeptidase family serine peptidase, partial [Steroidobacter sp.]|uniref:S9 family peptidase n=1 Tax=Steroidobacter sp. TaxID=1978227 RepID=UPI001A42B613
DTADEEGQARYSLNFFGNSLGVIDKVTMSLDESDVTFERRPGAKRSIDLDDLLTIRTPQMLRLSADGQWLVYRVAEGDLATNRPILQPTCFFVVSTKQPNATSRALSLDAATVSNVIWTPDGKGLVYSTDAELRLLDIASGEHTPLLSAQALQKCCDEGGRYEKFGYEMAFSPDGRYLALQVSRVTKVPTAPKPLRSIEVLDPRQEILPQDRTLNQLWVLDMRSREPRLAVSEDYEVVSFDWSPDSTQFVFAGCRSAAPGMMRKYCPWVSDLFVANAERGDVRVLIDREGADVRPRWSPDGRTIAFLSQPFLPPGAEYDGAFVTTLAVVDASGAAPPRFIGEHLDRVASTSIEYAPQWTLDGAALDIKASHHLSQHVFRVRLRDGNVTRLTPRTERHYWESSYSADGRTVAFTEEGVGVPADILVSATTRMSPRVLTHLNPEWDSLTVPTAQTVHWPSADGRWTIHGLLIKPSHYQAGRRYPLLVAIQGGPGQVDQVANPPHQMYPVLALVERGYAVLLPNSRGRDGFGRAFRHAIRDEQSYVLHQAQDVIDGVDAMIASGLADPDKLGLLGFSYGETLGLQVLRTTDRFRAAVVGGGTPHLLSDLQAAPSELRPLYRDLYGLSSPFDPAVIARAFEQTALFSLHRISTPVMIEAGERDSVAQDSMLFAGLRDFGLPAELHVIPRSGHGWEEPLLLKDAYERQVAWLDYWLLRKPLSDNERQARYDQWQQRKEAS